MKLYKIKLILVVFMVSICFLNVCGQSQNSKVSFPVYKEALHIVNPAFAGVTGKKEALAMVRTQFSSGIESPDKKQYLSYAMPFKKNLSGAITITNNSFYVTSMPSVFIDFSYKLKLAEDKALYMGLKAGGAILSIDLSSIKSDNDQAFSQDVNGDFKPNFGGGVYFEAKKFYLGLSIPRILSVGYNDTNKQDKIVVDKAEIYLNAGYVFDLSSDLFPVKLTPVVMLGHTVGSSSSFELSANIELINKVEVAMAKQINEEGFNTLLMFKLFDRYKIGYGYEKTIKSLNMNFHEIILRATF